MRIGIIGGGAIGLLVASYARKANIDVTIITRTVEQKQKLLQHGLTLKFIDGSCEHYDVCASTSFHSTSGVDFLFIAVKQYDLQNVITKLQHELEQIPPLAFLQNGMSHLSLLNKMNSEPLFVVIVEHGALKESETTVVHTGKGKMLIGSYRGSVAPYRQMMLKLSEVGLPFVISDDWHWQMQKKLLANICINPLTALYRVENGMLISNSYLCMNMRAVFEEAIRVLKLDQKKQPLWEYVTGICEKTKHNRSSMLRDFENEKTTEIDAICGYFIEEAKKNGTSLSLIPFLYHSIKGLERERRESHG